MRPSAVSIEAARALIACERCPADDRLVSVAHSGVARGIFTGVGAAAAAEDARRAISDALARGIAAHLRARCLDADGVEHLARTRAEELVVVEERADGVHVLVCGQELPGQESLFAAFARRDGLVASLAQSLTAAHGQLVAEVARVDGGPPTGRGPALEEALAKVAEFERENVELKARIAALTGQVE